MHAGSDLVWRVHLIARDGEEVPTCSVQTTRLNKMRKIILTYFPRMVHPIP